MKTVQFLGTLAIASALASAAHAQDATSTNGATPAPMQRAQVKSDARTAEMSGTMPHGDMPIASTTPTNAATDRAKLKSDTTAYNKTKQPVWMPNSGPYYQGNTMKSTADRATVKADTKTAESNQMIPRGQAAQPMVGAQTSTQAGAQ